MALEAYESGIWKDGYEPKNATVADGISLTRTMCRMNIKKLTEEYDAFCARYGGDEFVIIIKGISHDEMVAFCSKLRERVLECGLEHRYSKVMPMVTISQGACWGIPLRGNRMWDYLHAADDMLYKVKNFSRNN